MQIKHASTSGTMESSDIMVTLTPNEGNGVEIDLNSTVEKQFGREIRQAINEMLDSLGVTDVKVTAVDKGALDCAIRARVKTAVYRACDNSSYIWGGTEK